MNWTNNFIIDRINFFFLLLPFFGSILASETPIREISLSGLITDRKQEISGMDWYGDDLFLLPENLNGHLFVIPKTDLARYLNNPGEDPILPHQIPFNTPNYDQTISGFDSFEAIVFKGNDVFITIEVKLEKAMTAYLVRGNIDPTTKTVSVPEQDLVELIPPAKVPNMSYESILVHDENVILFYEVNGQNILDAPEQYAFSPSTKTMTTIPFPFLEYRLTDVTRLNDKNRFWGINYFWPGDKRSINPAKDSLTEKFHQGKSHSQSDAVERLVEFEIREGKIQFSGRAPIQLVLDKDGSRNWEAIARLDDKGFLIATDKHPRMILGFVSQK